MWTDLLKKAKCLLKHHEGEWEYAFPQSCSQTQVCVNCGAKSERFEHRWQDWACADAISCRETRECERCAQAEERVLHAWGPAQFQRAGSCAQLRVCARCGEEETLEAQHQWARWEQLPTGACVEVQICGRCEERSAQGRVAHVWGDWEYAEAQRGPVHSCRRCGEIGTRAELTTGDSLVPVEPSARASQPAASFQDLVRRRDEIMERLWVIEETDAPADAPEILTIARRAREEFSELLEAWDGHPETPDNPGETGRLFRYIGDTCFSVSARKDTPTLMATVEFYRRGEPLLESAGAALELAKLRFNLANTLRLLAKGRDAAALEEARRRYNEARQIFQREAPDKLELVESSLQSLEVQIRALSFYAAAEKGRDQLQELKQTLERAEPDDRETDRRVDEALTQFKATEASPGEQLNQFRSFVEQAADLMPASGTPEEKTAAFEKMQAELANLSAQFSTGEDRERDNQFSAMFAELEKAGERGEFSATRQAAFRGILQRFQTLVREPAKTMDQKVSRLERMRAQISENKHIFTEAKSHQGRAARIEQAFAAMRSFLMDEMNQSHLTETERTAAFELYGDAGKARTELARVQKNDAAVLDLEHDWLRPLAYRVRRFGLRHHLTLAEPLWGWSDVEVNPNAIFFAGSDELREKVDAVCRERRLQLAQDSVGWGAGQVRWNRLRESAIGVFDLTQSSAGEHASVCHALGSALALGIYPVVVTHTAGDLPFDIDLPPVPLEAEPEEALRRSLDAALFGRYSTAGGGALEQTARQVLKRVPKKDATASPLRKRLAEKQPLDPIDAEKMFDYLLARNARGKAALLFPAWRPFYPGGKARRCFSHHAV